MYPRVLLALLPLLFPTAAHALDCDNANDQRTMNQCADQDYKAADKELNTLYQQITQRLKDNPDARKLLVDAQRNWVAFRDTECKFSTSTVSGGSIYPMIYSICLTGQTKVRVEAFKQYLKCEEGDLSCPVPGGLSAQSTDVRLSPK
jgi:uncharacterized protein YecT (DUF1311 family)